MKWTLQQNDLRTIAYAEIGFMKMWNRFASLEELISSGALKPEMSGRFTYVYGIDLSAKSINAHGYPVAGEMLRVLHSDFIGRGIEPPITNLQLPPP